MFDAQSARYGFGCPFFILQVLDAHDERIDYVARVGGEKYERVDVVSQVVKFGAEEPSAQKCFHFSIEARGLRYVSGCRVDSIKA